MEFQFRGFCESRFGTETICVDGKNIVGDWFYGYYQGNNTIVGCVPYLDFIHSSPEELAEKLLKASCCYCIYGKDGELNCNNTEGAHCKEGILAYLTGKTLD